MPTYEVSNISATKDSFTLTAREGEWDGKKTLKIQHCASVLSDNGGAGFIKDEVKWKVKGTMHAVDAPTTGGITRPNTQVAQTFLKTMKLKKYKMNGAVEFELA